MFRETGAIVFSVRGEADVHVLICNNEDYRSHFCYWIKIGGWHSNVTLVHRCENGVGEGETPDSSDPCYFGHTDPINVNRQRIFLLSFEVLISTITDRFYSITC